MTWLQSGPFLEVSFVKVLETDRRSFVDNLLNKLKSFTPAIELATTDTELQEKIIEFNTGYPDDEADPNAQVYHLAQIPIYVDTDGKRKSILSLQQISTRLIVVGFWFFGAGADEARWGQRGLEEGQVHLFKDMLHALFDTFQFAIGTVAYENSVTDLFDTSDTWPHESYNLENIDRNLLQGDNYFALTIANRNDVDLRGIGGIKVTGDKTVIEAKPNAHNMGACCTTHIL